LITATPIPGDPTVTPIFVPQAATVTPTFVLPTLTAYPNDMRFTLGQSVEGRDIWAWQFGDGPFTLVLVGGIHGGFEGNTVVLAEELVEHFRETPEDVLAGVRLVIIPVSNPDGLLRGRDLAGRFNARGVDLNRNWGCEWSETAFIRDIPVDPGPRPFSEPETLALRTYFVASNPDAVVFYHSQAGGIFMGECNGSDPAGWMGELLSRSTGYPYGRFDYYEVSGDATNWLAERGIPAAIIELYTSTESESDRNLRGVMALQCHFAIEFAGGDIERTVGVVREKCD
jgi:hypothetical protein